MQYHDNDVFFSLAGGYRLISGSYLINEFSITDGQDPDKHIHNGLLVTCGADGKFTFNVGRKGSETVAKWFNSRIPANSTTFGHAADDLNFAFLGQLILTLTSGSLGDRQQSFVFNNIALAQGHSGASNNWWFGGKTAASIGNNKVNVSGSGIADIHSLFTFLRGGNSVSGVDVTPGVLIPTQDWLAHVAADTPLKQIVMPGSHDAGMSQLSHCNPFVGAEGPTKTQELSVGGQLASGSRYFDIRVDYDYSELVTYHRSGALGCNGQSLKSVLDEAKSFLKAHPTEFAILKFSHIRDYDGHNPADTRKRINDLLNSYQDILYSNGAATINIVNTTLAAVRGKIIAVFDYGDFIDPATGRFRYEDGNSAVSGANLTVYDNYANTSDYQTMQQDQLAKWRAHGGLGQNFLFLLSWTLTSGGLVSVKSLADEANGHLPAVLSKQIISLGWSKPNIVYIDFIDEYLSSSIIQYNFL
ncbi:hypothetical protein ACQZ61_06220 [Agrobacterium vitis]|uniref:hypothetical protein n=1 Tax=Agrobacterium vitis TaxID=373 RepID=UPI0015DB51F1|nr:hypothetical protein [Agrobacterium vitis]MCF1454729.1 hypothetical protein [Agrobacterium vitis]BCH55317.1 hypothetical protein RvVAR031_29270 [Agrobacterium vitis]